MTDRQLRWWPTYHIYEMYHYYVHDYLKKQSIYVIIQT